VCDLNGYLPAPPISQAGIRPGEAGPRAATEMASVADTTHWDAVDPAAVRLGWVKCPPSSWLVEFCSVGLTYLGEGSVNLTSSWGSKVLLCD
jgi:hypothetical protein